MRFASLALALGLTACAARSAVDPLALARADELVRQGCYDCLIEAREIYQAALGANRNSVLSRLLETELFIVLREKELALDPADARARAGALAAAYPASVDMGSFLALVDQVPPDAIGTPRRERSVSPPLARDGFAAVLERIGSSPFSALFRQYLAISILCRRSPAAQDQIEPAESEPPLLAYRRASCDAPIDGEALEAVREAVPLFVETSLFRGRAAMPSLQNSDGSLVRELFEEAYARFPNSPAVTYHLATVAQATGDCRRADTFFTETLALREHHEDARLGRAICRTYLSNRDGAIADATVLIDAETYNRAEAYYWRAWNRRSGKELDLARADIERARALLYNARVLTLAGMIEHDQAEFDKAREDLTRAREMDSRECQARWYLGLVGYATEQWSESAAGFADSADCYARLIAETEAYRAAMAARTDVTEEFRASQIAGFNAAIVEDSTQRSAADLNAAINYARAGEVERATEYMKRAWVDPERRTTVEDLRQVLGVPRW